MSRARLCPMGLIVALVAGLGVGLGAGPAAAAAGAGTAAAPAGARTVAAAVGAGTVAAPAPSANRLIVGGERALLGQVPWQVSLRITLAGAPARACGGALVGPQTVVTAAHCVADVPTGIAGGVPGVGIEVYAGGVWLAERSRTWQRRSVVSVRVHPRWEARIAQPEGDVAVLTLGEPFRLDTSAVQPVALADPDVVVDGEVPGRDPAVWTSGFGRQLIDRAGDGHLYVLPGSLQDPDQCAFRGGLSAVALCVASPNGSSCDGDSGSGVVTAGPVPRLLGVLSGGVGCGPGVPKRFASLVAPENRRFVEGSDAPPIAPRQVEGIWLDARPGVPVGSTIVCDRGRWTGAALVKWKLTDESGVEFAASFGPRLRYVVRAGDLGRRLSCRAYASNAGGVSVSRSASTATRVGGAPLGGPRAFDPLISSLKATATVRGAVRPRGEYTVRVRVRGLASTAARVEARAFPVSVGPAVRAVKARIPTSDARSVMVRLRAPAATKRGERYRRLVVVRVRNAQGETLGLTTARYSVTVAG